MWVSFVNRSCDQKRCHRVPVGTHEAHIPWDSHDISGSHIWRVFWGGNPCISTHYPSPFSWNLSTHRTLRSRNTSSFFWMDGLFVLPPIFAVSLVPPFCFAKTLPKKQISNDFRCGFPRRVQLTSKEQLVKTQLSLDSRPCGSWWLGGVEVYFVDSLMSQDLRHNSLTFLTIVSKGLQFLTNNLGHDCSLTHWVQRETSTGENASNFKMVHMWEREWPGWHILVPCCPATIANPMNFSTLDQRKHQVLNLQWEWSTFVSLFLHCF